MRAEYRIRESIPTSLDPGCERVFIDVKITGPLTEAVVIRQELLRLLNEFTPEGGQHD